MTTEPCNCPQSLEAENQRDHWKWLCGEEQKESTAAHARVDELKSLLDASEAVRQRQDGHIQAARDALAALRSRLDPGNVEAVERAAKAMHAAWDGREDPWPWAKVSEADREHWRKHARAALTALSGGG